MAWADYDKWKTATPEDSDYCKACDRAEILSEGGDPDDYKLCVHCYQEANEDQRHDK